MGSGHWPRPISNGMKKNLLVTLADKNYLDKAKQLFSSAYFNAGWQGDYMLLAHDIPEKDLTWFIDKGILVKECKPLYYKRIGGMPATITSKYYVFTTEFKQWDKIIFSDVDIIIRASLDKLTKVKGFGAVVNRVRFSDQFIDPKFSAKLKENYNLRSLTFNTGLFVLNSRLIEEKIFDELILLTNKYKDEIQYGDQPILNIFFYKKWEKLPSLYNIFLQSVKYHWNKQEKIKGIILHFPGEDKPWLKSNYFYNEWKDNLDKADKIDLQNIPIGRHWDRWKVISYTSYIWYLNLRYNMTDFDHFIDRKIGQFGLLLKKYSPRLYWALKGGKNK